MVITYNVIGLRSMVVYDRHIYRSCISPTEYDSPLLVDSDGVLSDAVAFQLFQSVAGRDSKIVEPLSAVHLNQFAKSNPINVAEAMGSLSLK